MLYSRKGFKMSDTNFKINLTKMIDEFSLEKIYSSSDIDSITIVTPEIIPERDNGRITLVIVETVLHPRSLAASHIFLSILDMQV